MSDRDGRRDVTRREKPKVKTRCGIHKAHAIWARIIDHKSNISKRKKGTEEIAGTRTRRSHQVFVALAREDAEEVEYVEQQILILPRHAPYKLFVRPYYLVSRLSCCCMIEESVLLSRTSTVANRQTERPKREESALSRTRSLKMTQRT